jgi:hypothetical protein
MSVLKVNDQTVTKSGTLSEDSNIDFYVADKLPLTITEKVDKLKYYFPNDPITFTLGLTLIEASTTGGGVTTLDGVSLEDAIPSMVVFDASGVSVSGSVTTPTTTVTGQSVKIEGISLNAADTPVTITITGAIADTI